MKVRITQNTQGKECWYANRIGETFDVSPYCHLGLQTGDWVGHNLDGSGKDCLIAAEDCEKLGGWQPIETAPKDKSYILLFFGNGYRDNCGNLLSVGFWSERHNSWWLDALTGGGVADYEPTHWMPLPEPEVRYVKG